MKTVVQRQEVEVFSLDMHLNYIWKYFPVAKGTVIFEVLQDGGFMIAKNTFVKENAELLPHTTAIPRDSDGVFTGTNNAASDFFGNPFAALTAGPPSLMSQLLISRGDATDGPNNSSGDVEDAPQVTVICARNPMSQDPARDLGKRFALLRHDNIGGGAFGNVFRAFDLLHGSYAAVKEAKLPRKGSTSSAQEQHQATLLAELKKEFDSLIRLKHPHIVAVYALELSRDFARI
jgi:hypothetical protein